MKFSLVLSLFTLTVASAADSLADQPPVGAAAVKASPEQLRKDLKGKRGLQGGDGGDNGADTGGGACFSGVTTVEVQGKGVISMDSLEVGDYVRAGLGEADFSRVYSFAHLNREVESEFLQIFSEDAKQPIELTSKHMIFANNKAVRAEAVKVGDMLNADNKVTEIKTVTRDGIFAPVTESGELMVNGVRASSYVALMDHVAVNQHNLIHMFFAPQRVACSINFDWCKDETYTHDGFSNWSNWAAKMYMAANDFSAPIQHLLTVLCVLVLPIWSTAEQFFVSPLASIAVLGFVAYKSAKKVKSA